MRPLAVLLFSEVLAFAAGQAAAAPEREGEYEKLYRMGLADYEAGRFEQSKNVFERAIQLWPRGHELRTKALWNAGVACFGSGSVRLAVRYFAEALAAQPEDPRLWHGFGQSLAVAGQKSAAEHAFRRGLSFDPRGALLLNDLAGLYLMRRQYETALPLFRSAMEFSSDLPLRARARITGNLAMAERSAGSWKAAVPLLRQAIALMESLGEGTEADLELLWYEYAEALRRSGQAEAARSARERWKSAASAMNGKPRGWTVDWRELRKR